MISDETRRTKCIQTAQLCAVIGIVICRAMRRIFCILGHFYDFSFPPRKRICMNSGACSTPIFDILHMYCAVCECTVDALRATQSFEYPCMMRCAVIWLLAHDAPCSYLSTGAGCAAHLFDSWRMMCHAVISYLALDAPRSYLIPRAWCTAQLFDVWSLVSAICIQGNEESEL